MPRFATPDAGILLSTSFKVMYSSFVETGLLEEVREAPFAALFAERCREPGFRHLVAVRNPYARLASFFADKLRRALVRPDAPWQFSQIMFFPLVGVSFEDSDQAKRDALLAISFEAFIDFLPQIWGNGHLRPQVMLLYVEGMDLRPYTKVFPIETEREQLWQALGISSPPWTNYSRDLPDLSGLSRERLDLINSIYANDFASFGYEPR